MSERRACKLLELDRSSYRYEPQPDRNAVLRQELIALARQKPRYGYRRLGVLLARRGSRVNHKRLYRLYCEESRPAGTAAETKATAAACSARGDAESGQPGMVDGLRDGRAGDGSGAAPADDGGQLHAGVPGDRSGQLPVEPARNARAGAGDGAARGAGGDSL